MGHLGMSALFSVLRTANLELGCHLEMVAILKWSLRNWEPYLKLPPISRVPLWSGAMVHDPVEDRVS